jgi:hypothetical protein
MKLRQFFTLLVVVLAGQANASSYRNMEPMTLDVPELKFEVTSQPEQVSNNLEVAYPSASPKMDVSFFKSKTNPGVKPYKFMDDMTFVGVPLFFAGWALKSEKSMFRVNAKAEQGGKRNTQLLTDFKTGIDDYTQFFGPAMVVGLKLGGYEGRSDWPRLLASAGMSYGIMTLLVNTIKYSAKEMRPDGSTRNSWPSGHTATAFVGATLLHKEYGLTRSPWWSVAGYGVATATGVMRVLNNRHWVSDVMSGAGLGILSGELGYALCDVFFKGKGLLRNDLELNNEKPTFFGISMGVGLGNKDLEFEEEGSKAGIKFRSATVVDAEGAYFFNKYIGVGGRLRVRAMSAKDFGQYAENLQAEDIEAWDELMPLYVAKDPNHDIYPDPATAADPAQQGLDNWITYINKIYHDASDESRGNDAPVTDIKGIIKSDHITEFTASIGMYFNLPLSRHFSLGTKALLGRSFTQDLDIDGYAEGNVKDINYSYYVDNTSGSGIPELDIDKLMLKYPESTGEKWTDEWEYLTVGAKSSTSFGTGLSLTYKYKSNFSWRLFCDYDYTRKEYTLTYDPYHFMTKGLTPGAQALFAVNSETGDPFQVYEYKKKKNMNYWTIGLSFLVNL